MPRNVEIKARARHWMRLHELAKQLAGRPPERLVQVDTFFLTPHGRLKLRQFSPVYGELIYYERPAAPAAKLSRYAIVPTDRPQSLCAALSAALGVRGVVRKERWAYFVGQTRVHLDRVEGLGEFLELEVMLADEQTFEDGRRIAETIQAQLGVSDDDRLEGAYVDMLSQE